MINKSEFQSIRKDLKQAEQTREQAILLSRVIIKLSKEIIYAVHRDDLKKAESALKEITKKVKDLPKQPITGIVSAAKQEFVEAACFYEFIKNKKIPTRADIRIDTYDYLAGLCDFTGELVRKAVKSILDNKPEHTKIIKDTVEDMYGEFLQLDLMDWELRKKYDSIKYNLKKLEDIMYDMKIKGK